MLPPEIWQTILRYSISVPVFLDPDAVERISPWIVNQPDIEWNDERSYWEAERTRNALQRTCRLWDVYLRRYEHRFVRMGDVAHGLGAAQHLKVAVRV
ncbi:hypothetical protein CPB86DRAFT_714178, partial [Serendipita vermifera]